MNKTLKVGDIIFQTNPKFGYIVISVDTTSKRNDNVIACDVRYLEEKREVSKNHPILLTVWNVLYATSNLDEIPLT